MALDSYSLCPGGRNKKIRFCCPDKLKELEQIGNMLTDGQFKACVTLIEEIEKKLSGRSTGEFFDRTGTPDGKPCGESPDCACLTAAKLTALRSQSLWEQFIVVAEAFYQREPQNGTAVAELAIGKAAFGDIAAAVSLLVDGFELPEEGKALNAVILSTQMVSELLCRAGNPICGLALAKLLPTFLPQSEAVSMFLRRLVLETNLPAPLKGVRFNPFAPDDFTGRREYETIAPLIATGRWKTALQKLEALAEQAGSWPGVLLSLAEIQLWLCRNDDAFATLRKFADMPGVSEEDQADAMALVYMIDRRNLGDEAKVLTWEVTVNDFERAQERMLSESRLYSMDFDPQRYGNADNPPPRHIFMILDRAFPPDSVPPAIDNIPRQIGTAFLFGKQTDRDARLEMIEVLDANKDAVTAILADTLQDAMGVSKEPRTIRETPIIAAHIDGRLRFRNANQPTREQIDAIARDYVGEGGPFQQWWFGQAFRELDGKTPREAAADPKYRPRLLGMIAMIEFLFPARYALEATNTMRKTLGFAELAEITLPADDPVLALSQLPVTRWFRVDTTPIPNESLAGELAMLDLISEDRGALHFAAALLERPLRDIEPQLRALAFRILIDDAEDRTDYETAILWIDRARNEARELGISVGEWDVAELMVRIKEVDEPRTMQLINHIMAHHKNDQQVMAAMQTLFMQMGLINPDGTPTVYAQQQPRRAPVPAHQFSAVPPTQADGVFQTPREPSQPPGEERKLWVPD